MFSMAQPAASYSRPAFREAEPFSERLRLTQAGWAIQQKSAPHSTIEMSRSTKSIYYKQTQKVGSRFGRNQRAT